MVRNMKAAAVLLFIVAPGIPPLTSAGTMPTAKTEEVGLSSERLGRIHELVQRYMDAGSVTGAVTLVARHGRVAHFEAHGLMDLDAKRPITKDAISPIMSMTRPVAGVSILIAPRGRQNPA